MARMNIDQSSPLRLGFERILTDYGNVRDLEMFGRSNRLWPTFEALASELRLVEAVAESRHLIVKWSAGQGRWAAVPWIATLDKRETRRISDGVYVIYLFRADLEGVYLTINQGASWALATGNRREAFMTLRNRATELASRLDGLQASGFDISGAIALGSRTPLIRAYEASTIASKSYMKGSVPSDEALRADFLAALTAYQRLVPTDRVRPIQEQASPDHPSRS